MDMHSKDELTKIFAKRYGRGQQKTGIDSDNGTKFINGNIKRYADRRNITFTRSKPYQKNNNAHIEQKNFTHVRKIIGYSRMDTKEQQDMMNDLYRNELRLYINFFQSSQKFIKKIRLLFQSTTNTALWIIYYFPKEIDFDKISDEELRDVERELNNRPGKRLNFKMPQKVFNQYLNSLP
jgi:hypothetical protein